MKETKGQRYKRVLAELRSLAALTEEASDPESNHSEADCLLLELIDDAAITKAFNAIRKWYS
jgi:hypothetical protein